ncbi:MAG TPA: hypothetical protein VLH35_00410, partial [Candidatus Acidoferrales bacterium]|nr:hypothetical protein [Candidatus Acidoferrales bacterium]
HGAVLREGFGDLPQGSQRSSEVTAHPIDAACNKRYKQPTTLPKHRYQKHCSTYPAGFFTTSQ